MTTPNLPPLPPPEIVELGGKTTGYYASTTQELREAAYQAGRDAGLDEAAQAVEGITCPCCYSDEQQATAEECAEAVRALKSDAKENKNV